MIYEETEIAKIIFDQPIASNDRYSHNFFEFPFDLYHITADNIKSIVANTFWYLSEKDGQKYYTKLSNKEEVDQYCGELLEYVTRVVLSRLTQTSTASTQNTYLADVMTTKLFLYAIIGSRNEQFAMSLDMYLDDIQTHQWQTFQGVYHKSGPMLKTILCPYFEKLKTRFLNLDEFKQKELTSATGTTSLEDAVKKYTEQQEEQDLEYFYQGYY